MEEKSPIANENRDQSIEGLKTEHVIDVLRNLATSSYFSSCFVYNGSIQAESYCFILKSIGFRLPPLISRNRLGEISGMIDSFLEEIAKQQITFYGASLSLLGSPEDRTRIGLRECRNPEMRISINLDKFNRPISSQSKYFKLRSSISGIFKFDYEYGTDNYGHYSEDFEAYKRWYAELDKEFQRIVPDKFRHLPIS